MSTSEHLCVKRSDHPETDPGSLFHCYQFVMEELSGLKQEVVLNPIIKQHTNKSCHY